MFQKSVTYPFTVAVRTYRSKFHGLLLCLFHGLSLCLFHGLSLCLFHGLLLCLFYDLLHCFPGNLCNSVQRKEQVSVPRLLAFHVFALSRLSLPVLSKLITQAQKIQLLFSQALKRYLRRAFCCTPWSVSTLNGSQQSCIIVRYCLRQSNTLSKLRQDLITTSPFVTYHLHHHFHHHHYDFHHRHHHHHHVFIYNNLKHRQLIYSQLIKAYYLLCT